MGISINSTIKSELTIGRFFVPYRVYGNGKQTLACINGIQQSMAMWSSFVRRFSRNYTIVVFDFPNQGKGKIVSGSPYVTLEEQVTILGEVLKAAGIDDNITICSASWGGVIAACFSVKYPEKVKRLIMASMGTRPNQQMVETIRKGAEIPPENREEMAQMLIKSFGQNLPEFVKNKIVHQFKHMSQETLETFCQHGLYVIATREISTVVDLSEIKCNTVLLNGEKDTIIDLEDVKYLASQIPNSQMRVIKDVGHFLHLEKEELLDVYADILNSPS